MTDLSALVPWPFVALGIAASFWLGRRMRGPRDFGRIVSAGFVALALGVALSFGTSALHTACIESLRLCQSSGDGNMSYWFHALFAFPLYWVLMLALGSEEEPAAPDNSPFDDAVVAALNQYRQTGSVSERCPGCSEHIAIAAAPNAGERSGKAVRARCGCGKCNGTFILQPTSA